MFLVPLKHNQSKWLFTNPNFITIIQLLAVQSPQPLSTTFLLRTQSDVKLWAYSDVSLELFPHPRRGLRNGYEGAFYRDTEGTNGVPQWDRLGEGYNGEIGQITAKNYPPAGDEEITDIPRPEMILDRFSVFNPDGKFEDVWARVLWMRVPADPYHFESADKSTKEPLFPGR